jgi:cytoskeleton protein RodZ
MAIPAQSSDKAVSGREYTSRAAPMSIGAELRDARERRGLSLAQLSRTTKISVTTLRSIEIDQVEKLPEPVFLRGFLRAYAREVGLNPEDTVRRYTGQFLPATEIAPVAGTSQMARKPTRAAESATYELDADSRSMRAQWLLIAVFVVVAGYVAIHWRANGRDAPDHSPRPAEIVQPTSSPAASSRPTTRPEIATAGYRDTVDGEALRIDLHPHALCWVSVTVDGVRVVHRLMQPGEQQTIEVHDEAVLRVGDPAAFAFSINSTAGKLIGLPGEPVTVRVTPQNFRTFVTR